jgi:ariadne-1
LWEVPQALSTLDKVVSDKLEDLSEITATPTSQLKFVTDAWAQVVDCRRMLKWTYAFGYYRFADQTAASKPQQEFFEFNQVGNFAWLSLATLCPIAHIIFPQT